MGNFNDMLAAAIKIAQLVAEAEEAGDGSVIDEGRTLLLAILEGEEIPPSSIDVLRTKLEGRLYHEEEEIEEEKLEAGVEVIA